MSNTTYRLLCVVEGEKYAFRVVASPGDDILDLKVKIKEQISGFLQGIDAARLILWKPTVVIPVDSSIDLCEYIRNLGPDSSQFAENLSSHPTDLVGTVFPNQNSPHLSIIVELPTLHPRPFKRQCLDDTSSLVEEFTPFWDRL
ncbi:hypothetical protein BC826DRAFT_122465 [Russula brevipes]|nr:hypothetical protein BC826DRAFT_122465 [Russula brevipes]